MSDADRLREVFAGIGERERQLIGDAMMAANPEIEGDLFRHLMARGVDGIVRDAANTMERVRRGRSRYVQGWRP